MNTTDDSIKNDLQESEKVDSGSTENYDQGADTDASEHIIVERYSYSPRHDEYNVLGGSFYDDDDDW